MSQDRSPSPNYLTVSKTETSTNHRSPEKPHSNTTAANNNSTIFKTPDARKIRGNNGGLTRSLTVGSGSKSPVRRHLRTMSITSNTSPACNSTTNSARKGINIGISLVGPVPSGSNGTVNKEKDLTSKTPRRKLFPSKQIFVQSASPNLNELDEEQHVEMQTRENLEVNNNDITSIMNSSPTPLSPSKLDSIPQDELSENFRLLASKEMEVLEIKNQLKDLLQRKKDKEFELQQLKLKIEKQLMANLKQQNNDQYRHRFEQHTPKSPTSLQKSVVQPSSSYVDPLMDDSFFPVSSNSADDERSKRQSWFAKPLNFIQQFDSLIYKEFEKLQIPDDDELNVCKDTSVLDMSYTLDQSKSLKPKEINAPIKSLAGDGDASGTDVVQSMSQHLWSFVNDVKSNLLVEENEPVSQPPSESSVKSSSQLVNPKNRLRTASISKRQSYSQHNHKKRSSSNSLKNEAVHSGNNDKQDIRDEFTTERISSVVQSISKHDDSGSEIATEMKSGVPDKTLDKYIKDSDLWDSEPLDL
ncbi:hypothetical protein PICMEDRAFT_9215 [Pichia membranifaciens NRRL Y-2026]|uniref:Topoisomerase I damage affected protein 11 n=1 Tax=Pichia membranifaciens NRRL Y-2026 TaxID=763406 RepID=A0A1E3NSN9_9ASCO|nr:hypothetical protein PICMEDRAFT_9215 [Pichia membranifaciens NRRL Y-2026]ODQ48688.1 hypothetical protein PICMEDRAFT_9215 [Pichia membranifaciens NRRL Y-2026]